ncbi:MAG: alpha/beta fold hydrolase [Candidatus Binatia bacterium]
MPRSGDGPNVVLLHGLIRTGRSMTTLGKALSEAGYRVCNVTYPSRHHSIDVLASQYVAPSIAQCFPENKAPIAFVTHSMGGIIVRQLAAQHAIPSLGRVVMLGPPNAGSELVDEFGDWWLFRAINGPAALELGTATDSTPRRLGPATFEVGIIAGTRSRNPVWSRFFDERNDGKVSVASAALVGMKDFLEIDENHTFIMRNREAIDQTLRFLKEGTFARNPGVTPSSVVAERQAPVVVAPQEHVPATVRPATHAVTAAAPAS